MNSKEVWLHLYTTIITAKGYDQRNNDGYHMKSAATMADIGLEEYRARLVKLNDYDADDEVEACPGDE